MSITKGWKALPRTVFGGRRCARRSRQTSFAPGLNALEGRILLSTLVVTDTNDNGPGSLRQAIVDAQGGDSITFASNLNGQTITLTSGELVINKDLDIEGLGADDLTISGNDSSRIFNVAAGVNATIAGLTITHGKSSEGGGIINYGNLSLEHSDVTANQALGELSITGWSQGGGIANEAQATLTILQSTISGNQAIGAPDDFIAGLANGGGIVNMSALTIINSTLSNNLAIGGASIQNAGGASGGGIGTEGVTIGDTTFPVSLQLINTTLIDNQAIGASVIGGPFSSGGVANGGGIAFGSGTATLTGSTFIGNRAVGGNGGFGFANGGGISTGNAIVAISHSSFMGNEAIGGNGGTDPTSFVNSGQNAQGGAISSSDLQLTITDSIFSSNRAMGGDAGASGTFSTGGIGTGGAIMFTLLTDLSNEATITGCGFTGNQAIGGAGHGASGGEGSGGAIALMGSYQISDDFTSVTPIPVIVTISGTTITGNLASGGTGEIDAGIRSLTGGVGDGGGVSATLAQLTLQGSTLGGNRAVGGAGMLGSSGGLAQGGGLASADSNTTITSTLVINNQAIGGAGSHGTSGGNGGSGGDAQGGGIGMRLGSIDLFGGALASSDPVSTLTFTDGLLTNNLAEGGVGGDGDGTGTGGVGGSGLGGGAASTANGILTIKRSLFTGNRAQGGLGGQGAAMGQGLGGGVSNAGPSFVGLPGGMLIMTDTLVVGNFADGDPGLGGGLNLEAGSSTQLTRTLIVGNRASSADDNVHGS